MSPLLNALGRAVSIVAFLGIVCGAVGQSPTRSGGEYAVIDAQPHDQINPQTTINELGGLVVWQDYSADGDGWGINARRLNSTLSGQYSVFRVNETGNGNQENPQVVLLSNQSAVFAWQGGKEGQQNIYYRVMDANGVFITADMVANTFTPGQQAYPSLATGSDGGFVIVWTSENQDGNFLGVFGQRFKSDGIKDGNEFRVNQTVQHSQRSPSVAFLRSGNFVVSWISELLLPTGDVVTNANGLLNLSVNTFARIYNGQGVPIAGEFRVNNSTNLVCANPQVVPFESGDFLVTWSGKDVLLRNESWDIYSRAFNGAGNPLSSNTIANVHRYGDQFRPQGAALGGRQLLVWTSLGQDTSFEGVYGRFLSNGVPVGMDQRINSTTLSKQIQPVVASDSYSKLLVIWSSFVGRGNGFDLYAQRFAGEGAPQLRPPAPYVSALSQSRLSITWPVLAGYNLEGYLLTINGSATPLLVSQNYYILTGLAPSSTHSFALAYRYAGGGVSPLSPVVQGTTWGDDFNDDALPDDWQARYWGGSVANWPGQNNDSDSDGVSDYREFLLGTDPTDKNSVLRTYIEQSPTGTTLSWNSQAGFVYQVQTSTDLNAWANLGHPYFAPSSLGSVVLEENPGNRLFYRVIRIR